jgi:hypothetical protein
MTDIIPLLRHAWDVSFGRANIAKKAVANRGWGPLNYVLLDSPDLIRDDRQNTQLTKRKINHVSQEEVDINQGELANGYLVMLFEDKLKTNGLQKIIEEQHEKNKEMSDKYDAFKDKTNWTSGKICSNGIFCLTN